MGRAGGEMEIPKLTYRLTSENPKMAKQSTEISLPIQNIQNTVDSYGPSQKSIGGIRPESDHKVRTGQ